MNFGRPPRALESFGVIGILSTQCKIYYDTIFTSRHVGRVTDLLFARLKEKAPDELRFRIILTFSLYEAYRCQLAQSGQPGPQGSDALPEPLVIECGVDDEKIAVGVSLTSPENEPVDPNLAQKIASGGVKTRFERFVAQLVADADQVIIRIQPESRRVEIISLLGLPEKIDPSQLGGRRGLEVVLLKADSKVSPLKGEYVELGDIDYKKLLEDDGPGGFSSHMATGEILAQGAAEAAEQIKVKGTADSEKQTRLKAGQLEKEKITRISGTTEHLGKNDEEIKVTDEADEQDDLTIQIDSGDELSKTKKRLELYRTRIVHLQSKIQNLETSAQNEIMEVRELSAEFPASPETEEKAGFGRTVKTMIKSFFGRRKDQGVQSGSADTGDQIFENTPVPLSNNKKQIEEGDPITDRILREQVERLEATITKMRGEAQSMKGESSNARTKKWADGMVGELLAEKARISEMSKTLNLAYRQKEYDFRSREARLTEELRRKDDLLRQKTHSLERAKEQVSQMTMTVERSKNQHQSGSDEGQLRQKLGFTQKLLQNSKDENLSLTKRVEELRNQLMMLQTMTTTKQRASGDADLAGLKTKLDRTLKQNEEFKRANQTLMEKLNEIQKPKPGSMSNDELKKKLETAMRLAATYQKDSDQLRLKVEELQREEARLKGEVNRVTNAMRSKKPGGQAA